MSLENDLHDMKMNDDDSITSYFVRISQLRYQLQAIEHLRKGTGKYSTQWPSQDMGFIFHKHEHKKGLSHI
jgi:hypothetical protein